MMVYVTDCREALERAQRAERELEAVRKERDALREALVAVRPFAPISFVSTGRPGGAVDRVAALQAARDLMERALSQPVQPVEDAPGRCPHKKQPGGCPLPSVHCNYPACDLPVEGAG